jgi:hypothetical protein
MIEAAMPVVGTRGGSLLLGADASVLCAKLVGCSGQGMIGQPWPQAARVPAKNGERPALRACAGPGWTQTELGPPSADLIVGARLVYKKRCSGEGWGTTLATGLRRQSPDIGRARPLEVRMIEAAMPVVGTRGGSLLLGADASVLCAKLVGCSGQGMIGQPWPQAARHCC